MSRWPLEIGESRSSNEGAQVSVEKGRKEGQRRPYKAIHLEANCDESACPSRETGNLARGRPERKKSLRGQKRGATGHIGTDKFSVVEVSLAQPY